MPAGVAVLLGLGPRPAEVKHLPDVVALDALLGPPSETLGRPHRFELPPHLGGAFLGGQFGPVLWPPVHVGRDLAFEMAAREPDTPGRKRVRFRPPNLHPGLRVHPLVGRLRRVGRELLGLPFEPLNDVAVSAAGLTVVVLAPVLTNGQRAMRNWLEPAVIVRVVVLAACEDLVDAPALQLDAPSVNVLGLRQQKRPEDGDCSDSSAPRRSCRTPSAPASVIGRGRAPE